MGSNIACKNEESAQLVIFLYSCILSKKRMYMLTNQ